MIIGLILLLLFDIYTRIHCQLLRSNCSFFQEIYFSHSSVAKQILFINSTSIVLTANHAFLSKGHLTNFELGLIYQFPGGDHLVPFPVIFNCATMIRTCQLKTISTTTITSHESEPINVQLTPLNLTTTTRRSTVLKTMGLYLKQGRYQLSNCSLNSHGNEWTDVHTSFDIQIHYEKSVGTPCDSTVDICGSSLLTSCSSSKCTCLSSSTSLVSYSNSYFCADMFETSNCTIFPSRCVTWCNQTRNYLCICPRETLKIQREQFFVCELPINARNCSVDSQDIRRCPLGQCCFHEQCVDCSIVPTRILLRSNNLNESLDDHLRIALGIIAGLLGVSMLILFGTCAWLRFRQKRRRVAAKKTPSNSSTSSLYISPIQQPTKLPSIHTSNSNYPTVYRTNSFRRAVLSGNPFPYLIERVSTKPDLHPNETNSWFTETFNGFEYIMPSTRNDMEKSNHIYQIILPPTPVLTHAV